MKDDWVESGIKEMKKLKIKTIIKQVSDRKCCANVEEGGQKKKRAAVRRAAVSSLGTMTVAMREVNLLSHIRKSSHRLNSLLTLILRAR